jgi:hypothetical protein
MTGSYERSGVVTLTAFVRKFRTDCGQQRVEKGVFSEENHAQSFFAVGRVFGF